MKNNDFPITKNDVGRRVDRIIRKMFPSFPLNKLYRLIRKGYITLNGHKTSPGAITVEGDILNIIPSLAHKYQYEKEKQKQHQDETFYPKTELQSIILFENTHIIVINKPAGITVHGKNSLEQRVRAYLIPGSTCSLSFTPGPAHRLDRNTSGLIIFSKSLEGAKALTEAFKRGHIKKVYIGLFEGTIKKREYWTNKLTRNRMEKVTVAGKNNRAKEAVTKIIPVATDRKKTLSVCIPLTGKTHQIRAQAALHRHPLFCDRKYGSRAQTGHYMLHAAGLSLPSSNPILGSSTFFARLPEDTKTIFELFFGKKSVKASITLVKKLCNEKADIPQ
jgi:23S rRNA pseudouridine955/2504/2580 synthase